MVKNYYYLPLKRGGAFHLNKMKSFTPMILCANFCRIWPSCTHHHWMLWSSPFTLIAALSDINIQIPNWNSSRNHMYILKKSFVSFRYFYFFLIFKRFINLLIHQHWNFNIIYIYLCYYKLIKAVYFTNTFLSVSSSSNDSDVFERNLSILHSIQTRNI